jgi:hypothetical protein
MWRFVIIIFNNHHNRFSLWICERKKHRFAKLVSELMRNRKPGESFAVEDLGECWAGLKYPWSFFTFELGI